MLLIGQFLLIYIKSLIKSPFKTVARFARSLIYQSIYQSLRARAYARARVCVRARERFAPQAPARRATSGTNKTPLGGLCNAKQKSRDGVVFSPKVENLHPSKPLTSVFFGLFRLRRRNKELSALRPVVLPV